MSLFKKSLNGKRLSETMADFVDRAERSPFSVVSEGMNASSQASDDTVQCGRSGLPCADVTANAYAYAYAYAYMNASLHRMQRVSEFAGRMSHPSWQTDQFIFKHGGGYA